jgi:hypothetical protein
MLFPNFDVPSVGEKIVGIFLRSRMSLSHLNGRERHFGKIHLHFMVPGRRRPGHCPQTDTCGGIFLPPKSAARLREAGDEQGLKAALI